MVAALTLPGQGGTYALVPPGYRPNNRWVINFHGYGQSGNQIMTDNNEEPVMLALVNAGYVVISMQNTMQNCFGNAQCVADTANTIALWKSYLSLAGQGYATADSMGGFTMLNSISHGTLKPRACVGWSINTDLNWDYLNGGAPSVIDAAYGTPYATATAGYDPMLQPTSVYTPIPMMLWASPSDNTVLKANNSDAFATRINGAGGNVVVNTVTGGHLDPSNFNPTAVVNFFNAN
jgi:hypothetical protein